MMGHQVTTAARRAIATTAACVLLMVLPARGQSPAPASSPSPANGAVGVAVGVTLSWSAGSDARRFDVRLGTTPSPPVVARNLTTAAYQPPSPLTAGTTYYWRIDVRGRGSSITEGPLWSFTTAAAPPPSAPASPSPANAATNVGVTTAVSWAASSNATSYTVAFGTSSTPPVVSSGQTGTSYDPPGDLAASTTYFWRVTATGPGGSTTGPLWSFTTAAAPTPTPSAPASPTPANGATGVGVTTAVSWAASSNATSYTVAFGTSSTPPVVSSGQTGTSYDPPGDLTASTTYFWQVTATGPGGSTTGPLWSFTTAAAPTPAPSAPASPSPANGATNVGVTTAVSWAASSNATSYAVAFGTSSTPPVVSSGQTGTSYDPPGDLTASTTYFWRVTATGPGGSTAGPLWSFTTAAAPPPPPSTSLDRLRLMTWNVQHGLNAAKTKAVDAQVELMADSGAHVIVLQEVTINADGDLPALYQSKLQTLTGVSWNAVWAPVRDTSTPEGNLILTRLPVVSSATIKIDSEPGDPTFLDAKRSAAQVAVIVNGVRVNVVTTHLALSATHRQAQLDMLQTWVASFPAPRLLGGDFNFVQGESAYADMAGGFTDAWPVLAGTDPGYTMDVRTLSPQPGRIDYWWQEKTDASARVTEIWVLKTRRSDHHAVVVDVEVK